MHTITLGKVLFEAKPPSEGFGMPPMHNNSDMQR